jgi:hypothetical protein
MVATSDFRRSLRFHRFFEALGTGFAWTFDQWADGSPECIKPSVQFEFGKIKKIFRKFIFPTFGVSLGKKGKINLGSPVFDL